MADAVVERDAEADFEGARELDPVRVGVRETLAHAEVEGERVEEIEPVELREGENDTVPLAEEPLDSDAAEPLGTTLVLGDELE